MSHWRCWGVEVSLVEEHCGHESSLHHLTWVLRSHDICVTLHARSHSYHISLDTSSLTATVPVLTPHKAVLNTSTIPQHLNNPSTPPSQYLSTLTTPQRQYSNTLMTPGYLNNACTPSRVLLSSTSQWVSHLNGCTLGVERFRWREHSCARHLNA